MQCSTHSYKVTTNIIVCHSPNIRHTCHIDVIDYNIAGIALIVVWRAIYRQNLCLSCCSDHICRFASRCCTWSRWKLHAQAGCTNNIDRHSSDWWKCAIRHFDADSSADDSEWRCERNGPNRGLHTIAIKFLDRCAANTGILYGGRRLFECIVTN